MTDPLTNGTSAPLLDVRDLRVTFDIRRDGDMPWTPPRHLRAELGRAMAQVARHRWLLIVTAAVAVAVGGLVAIAVIRQLVERAAAKREIGA